VSARRLEEAQYFNSVTGHANAIVLSHLEPPNPVSKKFIHLRHVGILASENLVNYNLVKEFLLIFNQKIKNDKSPCLIHIGGQVSRFIVQYDDGESPFRKPYVKIMGYIENLTDFYASMDLIVSPVMVGTGINVKTVQAMAYGLPLISTRCGTKGIETDSPHHNHVDVESLVDDIFVLAGHPGVLQDLADLSIERYREFYSENMNRFDEIFMHQKIQ
jgi:glycosyltransferase involved in cell wall biosynthesis